MEKKMENAMETGVIRYLIGIRTARPASHRGPDFMVCYLDWRKDLDLGFHSSGFNMSTLHTRPCADKAFLPF